MELVYYKGLKEEPYTTLNIIAESVDQNYKSVRDKFYKHKDDLKRFGILTHEKVSIKGVGQPEKVWKLNEAQATFFITLLGNSPKVVKFKSDLVLAFMQMRKELDQAKLSRELNKRANIDLADTIKAELPNDPHAYSNYHQLAYKYATGMTPKQLKKAKGVNKPEEALDNDQKERLERAKQHIALYLLDGNDYQDIKAKLFADI
ncbi:MULTISPECIES: Rha family transcriptional regulator [Fructobacillus]|uniref:Phage regulatory protein Rha (PRha) n=1 Tax=Fructobacillus tropaeoli TaxID=709323 RepID=A0ABM9MUL7_9LACO|nr:Phage regulatory protein Rha (pRha) [Fructobacillus sp. LMG 32999]CAK1241144.1 Phage regulatory protein Rha (pRha) [Fructobacillus tropaeoli]